jgi:hypothetical protein
VRHRRPSAVVTDAGDTGQLVFPQQDPGPAQPACPGTLPQQAVSAGPGSRAASRPVIELVGDISLVVRSLPQYGHTSASVPESANTSPARPHSSQTIS